ncbi:RagB/SusD family nutrient uptake outer membrane protein [Pseudoflavitalea rhizosphaerae]|uniref:RagB/SusD family nutrient uptake outer membrane protein n=1 Tax=Pseudoflavitalea rhizosphaerae TaxID=1884793 RepID=UPI000F8E0FC7|nr:RagB/SusD family nutrient uptake outer membrane protein [Pseudoflavitalea rhizosphaerae]
MKKIFIYLLPVCLLATSCKKFLEETSSDEIRPSSVEDMTAFMHSDAYPYTTALEWFSDMLTDDVKSNGLPKNTNGTINTTYIPFQENGKGVFGFDPLELEGTTGSVATAVDAWKNYYNKIKGCNIVIDYTPEVDGLDTKKMALRGQALFLRGYYYLKLAQLYCLPYRGAGVNPETTPGLPLILTMQVSDEHVARHTLRRTFDQIEADLLEAAQLLKDNFVAPSTFRVGHLTAYAMLARFYLYRGEDSDMDKAIEYAGLVISERPQLTLLKNYIGTGNVISMSGIYDPQRSTEILWQYGSNPNSLATFYPAANSFSNLNPPFSVSDELRNSYFIGPDNNNFGDLRYTLNFFKYTNGGVQYPSRTAKIGMNITAGDKGIRTGEVYIIRAEAFTRRFLRTAQDADRILALKDLNDLRESRYDTRNTTYDPVDLSNGDALLTFVLEERRRELSFEENTRWADIKRLGLSVTHNLVDAEGDTRQFVLPANSPLYALPIPATAIDRNNNLIPNPR